MRAVRADREEVSAGSVAVMQKRFYRQRREADGQAEDETWRRLVFRQRPWNRARLFDDAAVGDEPSRRHARHARSKDVVFANISHLLQRREVGRKDFELRADE